MKYISFFLLGCRVAAKDEGQKRSTRKWPSYPFVSRILLILVSIFVGVLAGAQTFAYDQCNPMEPQALPCSYNGYDYQTSAGTATYNAGGWGVHFISSTSATYLGYSDVGDKRYSWSTNNNAFAAINFGFDSNHDLMSTASGTSNPSIPSTLAGFFFYGVNAPLPPAQTTGNEVYGIEFAYPKMDGNPNHADIQMPDLSSHADVRLHVTYSGVSDELKQHVQLIIVKMVDDNYDIVDTADPYLESEVITNLTNNYRTFNVPLLGGNTSYFVASLVYDDDVETESHVILREKFSLMGLTPDNPSYWSGQTNVLPPLDSDGGVSSTGSVVGDLLARVFKFLFQPNQTVLTGLLSSEFALLQYHFSPVMQIFTKMQEYPSSSNVALDLMNGNIVWGGHSFSTNFNPFVHLTIPSFIPSIISYMLYMSLAFWVLYKFSKILEE